MRRKVKWNTLNILFGVTLIMTPAMAKCPGRFAVEVLGSGGPLADDARASAGYLVWIDGVARLLVDAGGGVFLRFGEAGATFTDLDGVLISHFHADHVADLPAILKSGFFEERTPPLTIAGPSGNAFFPGLGAFLAATLDAERGAYRYLSGFLTGAEGYPRLDQIEVDAAVSEMPVIIDGDDLRVAALPVNHGAVPAIAFVASVDGKTVVFAGDQSVLSDFFDTALAGSAPELLIAHHAISEAKGQPRGLHRAPSAIGAMAANMDAQRLVLSHNMKRALEARREGLKAIRAAYNGPVKIVDDHACLAVIR